MDSPGPRPRITLPRERWSTVATIWASVSGCLLCGSETHVPSPILLVLTARAASVLHASTAANLLTPKATTWSANHRASNPDCSQSSAAWKMSSGG